MTASDVLRPTLASATAIGLAAAAVASLCLATMVSPNSPNDTSARASAASSVYAAQFVTCTGAITIADGAEIIGGRWGDIVTETVRIDVRCDGELPVEMRSKVGTWPCNAPRNAIEGLWRPFTSTLPVRLTIGAAWWTQSVLVQLRTRDGDESQAFCDDVVMHGHPPLEQTATPESTIQPTSSPTAFPVPIPIPTLAPTSTPTDGPSPTPTDGPPPPTSTPRTASVTGRIILANGAATISGALGHVVDVPLRLDLTASGAPLCQMRLRLSGGPCRDDADGGFATESWQPFHRVTGLEIPLAVHGSTISAWAQVTNADGDVSRAFCDDVVVHAPNTATPCGGSPTPRAPTPLPAVTACPRWEAPVFLPIVLDNPALPVR